MEEEGKGYEKGVPTVE